jgi:hypothetical protein
MINKNKMNGKIRITKAEHVILDQAKQGNIFNEIMIKLESKKMNNKNNTMIVVNALIGIELLKKMVYKSRTL